jgi:methionine aminopeptidase
VIRHGGEKKMIYENQEYRHTTNNTWNVLFGMLLGGLAGAVAMLLLAPQSGKDTRVQLQKKGLELRNRTIEMVDDSMAQVINATRSGNRREAIGARIRSRTGWEKGNPRFIIRGSGVRAPQHHYLKIDV